MTTPNAPEGVEPWSADDLVRIRALYPAEAGGPWSAEHRWLATVDALRAERDAALEAVSASETGRADARRERDAARTERDAIKGLLALLRDWAAKSPWDAAIALALRPTPTQEPPSVCPAGDATAQASSPGGGSPSLAPAPSPAPWLRDALVKVVAHTAHTPAAPRELLAGLLASCARIAKAALSAPAIAAPSAVVPSDADVVEVVRLIGVAIGQPDRWIDSMPAMVAFAVEQIRGLRFATLAAPVPAAPPVGKPLVVEYAERWLLAVEHRADEIVSRSEPVSAVSELRAVAAMLREFVESPEARAVAEPPAPQPAGTGAGVPAHGGGERPVFASIDAGLDWYESRGDLMLLALSRALRDAVQSLRWSDALEGRRVGFSNNGQRILNRLNGLHADGSRAYSDSDKATVDHAPVSPTPPRALASPVCGDHWHGLSGAMVNGSTGCPWCAVERLESERTTAENAPAGERSSL